MKQTLSKKFFYGDANTPSVQYPVSNFLLTEIKKTLFLSVLGLLIFSSYFIVQATAESQRSSNIDVRCIHMYEKFKLMGEENLRNRYPAKTIMNTCFTLYDDPKWDFPGKKIIDKKYHLDLVNSAKVKLLSTIKIGESKYLVKLSTCIESNPKPKYLLMTTDKEQVLGSISRPSKTPCTSFWGVIFANYPENTQFSWQYEDPASSKTVRKLF